MGGGANCLVYFQELLGQFSRTVIKNCTTEKEDVMMKKIDQKRSKYQVKIFLFHTILFSTYIFCTIFGHCEDVGLREKERARERERESQREREREMGIQIIKIFVYVDLLTTELVQSQLCKQVQLGARLGGDVRLGPRHLSEIGTRKSGAPEADQSAPAYPRLRITVLDLRYLPDLTYLNNA